MTSNLGLRSNHLRDVIGRGEVAVGFGMDDVTTPGVIYTAADVGADFVFIDLEHGSHTLEATSNLVTHAYASGMSALVRVPTISYEWITRLLDGGCQSIMVPHVKGAGDVRRIQDLARYAPQGHRGIGMYGNAGVNYRVIADHAAAAAWQNEQVVTGVVIEDAEGVDAATEILVPGVDFALIGAVDLAHSYGLLGLKNPPAVVDARTRVRELCSSRGIAFMEPVATVDEAKEAVDQGARMLLFGGVLSLLRSQLTQAVSVKH